MRAAKLTRRLWQILVKLSLILFQNLFFLFILCKDIFFQKLLFPYIKIFNAFLLVLNYHVLWHLILSIWNNLTKLFLKLRHWRIGHNNMGIGVTFSLTRGNTTSVGIYRRPCNFLLIILFLLVIPLNYFLIWIELSVF